MKLKFLYILLLIFCLSAFASSDESENCAAKNITCNMDKGKSVTPDNTIESGIDTSELSPISLLLFEI